MPVRAGEASLRVMDNLGLRFWAWLIGMCLAGAVVMFFVLLLFTRAIVVWGLFGTFLVVALLLVVVGWFYDRHEARHRGTTLP